MTEEEVKNDNKNEEQFINAMNIVNVLNPINLETTTEALIGFLPDQEEVLLENINQPLKIIKDSISQKFFIQSEFNRDGDAYRSPFSNQYFQVESNEDVKIVNSQIFPDPQLREMEEKGLLLFQEYTKLYYQDAIFSIFCWQSNEGFSFAYLVKKNIQLKNEIKDGSWECTTIINVQVINDESHIAHYKIMSTANLYISLENNELGNLTMNGVMKNAKVINKIKINIRNVIKKQFMKQIKLKPGVDIQTFHLQNIGEGVEENENQLRNQMASIYISKTKQIIFETRNLESNQYKDQQKKLLKEIFQKCSLQQQN